MMMLARSALVQGSALTSLIRLFRSVVQASLPGMSYADLFAQLYSSNVGGADLSKQALTNLSRCVAGIACTPQATQQALQRFVADLQNAGTTEAQKQLALLCLGEVGQAADLASLAGLKDLVLACFESKSEDTKLAAAFALGHIAVGNMGTFLPLVLQPAGTSKHQYLLLAAVKDMVVVFANQQKDFQPHLAAVLPVLLQQCKAEEDSVRTIVAECLGVLTTMLPDQIIPVLLQLSQDVSDKLSRRMIGNALRFSLSRSAASAGALQAITTEMHRFLPLLQDEDLDVKKAALLMVNTAVHHNASTIEAHLGTTVVPALIETLQIKLERVVDLGPFKHRVSNLHFHILLGLCTIDQRLSATLRAGGRQHASAQDRADLPGDHPGQLPRAAGQRVSGAGDAHGGGRQGRVEGAGAPGKAVIAPAFLAVHNSQLYSPYCRSWPSCASTAQRWWWAWWSS
jgi:cullin-associated NEDD8-dissociated protein 1